MLAQRDDLLKEDQACSVKRSGQSSSGKHSSSKSGFAGLPEGTMMLAQRDDLLKEDQACSGQLSSSKSWLVSVRRSQVQSVRACVESERQAGASDEELKRAVMESEHRTTWPIKQEVGLKEPSGLCYLTRTA